MLASDFTIPCDSLNNPNVMTERARALIGRMVVFGDTIGERVGLMFLTYYGAQSLTYVSVADVIRRSVCVDLESLPPPGLNLSGRHAKKPLRKSFNWGEEH